MRTSRSALPERTFHAAGQLSFKRKGTEDILFGTNWGKMYEKDLIPL